MKTPRFWNSKNWLSLLLFPLSGFYYLGCKVHKARAKPKKLSVPVLCIGNLTAGGAGKTPVALHIGELLKRKGIKAFFISRGYGGNIKTPTIVDIEKHRARQVGDEPLLLARVLPTVVCNNRFRAAELAIKSGAEIIVMDDGFQNYSIVKDLSLIVVDRRLSFGNEMMLPAGPLREPVAQGIKRADGVVIINPANFLPTALHDIPFFLARSKPKASMLALKDKKILAFCGLAYPQKFYHMLHEVGANIVERVSFADHHHYSKKELALLKKRGKQHEAILVTTSKDAVRLPDSVKLEVTIAEMELVFENDDKLEDMINAVLKKS